MNIMTKHNLATRTRQIKGLVFLLVFVFCGASKIFPQGYTNYSYIYSDIPKITASHYMVVDTTWNAILAEHGKSKSVSIASLTKLMTTLLTLEAVEKNTFNLEKRYSVDNTLLESLPIDASLMGLHASNKPRGIDLLKGLLIASGNDAALVIAQHIEGSVGVFVGKMNKRAKELGLLGTFFADPSGLSSRNISTAEDLAVLVRYLLEYKKYDIIQITSQKNMRWNGILKKNTNRLLVSDNRVDGIKTGYTEEAGFNYIATAKQGGRRLIAIVLHVNANSLGAGIIRRAQEAEQLLNYGFNSFVEITLKYTLPEVRVWGAISDYTNLITDDKRILLHTSWVPAIQAFYTIPNALWAPLEKNTQVGSLTYEVSVVNKKENSTRKNIVLASRTLKVSEEIQSASFFSRFIDNIIFMFQRPNEIVRVKANIRIKNN